MPHIQFNDRFLSPISESTKGKLDFSSIYRGKTPLYFESALTETNPEKQLETYESSLLYPRFKQQYLDLITKLQYWCVTNSAVVRLHSDTSTAERIPAFSLYSTRLFNKANYYGMYKPILYHEGKRSLEELLLLLRHPQILLPIKQGIMTNLQKSFDACSNGLVNNIIDAKDDLKAANEGVAFLHQNTLRTLIQQYALLYVQSIYGDIEDFNTHYATAFCNYASPTYGLPLKHDERSDALEIPATQREEFAQMVEQYLTPKTVLKALMQTLSGYIHSMKEEFSKVLGSKKQPAAAEKAGLLYDKANSLINKWNERYGALLPLDVTILLQANENGTAFTPAPYNEAPLRETLSNNFDKLFLKPNTHNSRRFAIPLRNNRSLIIHNGLYWVDTEGTLSELSVEKPRIAHTVLSPIHFNELIEAFPEYTAQLVRANLCPQNANPVRLIQDGHYTTLMAQLEYDVMTQEQIRIIRQPDFAHQMNTGLSPIQRRQLLRKLLDKGKLSSRVLPLLWQTVLSAHNEVEQPQLIDKLFTAFTITTDLLAETENEQGAAEFIGINIVWLLVYYKQFNLVSKLIRKNALTQEMLSAISASGINVVWLLAANKAFDLLAQLVERNLLTEEMLIKAPHKGENAGKDVLWILIQHKVYGLIYQMLNKGLLTRTFFEEITPTEAPYAGSNKIWLLAANQEFEFIQTLIIRGLVTSEMLAAKPTTESDTPGNVLWLLAYYQQYNVLEILLRDNLLTSELLAVSSQVGETTGMNPFWLLSIFGQWTLIEKLVTQRLITTEILASAPRYGENADKNCVWLLIACKQMNVLNALLDQGLITTELLAATPQAAKSARTNGIRGLVHQKEFVFLDRLLDNHLVTPQLLMASSIQDHIVIELARKGQFTLVDKLISNNLVTRDTLKHEEINTLANIFLNEGKSSLLQKLQEQSEENDPKNHIISSHAAAHCRLFTAKQEFSKASPARSTVKHKSCP